MSKCIICEREGIKLTEEHIIPNALGNNVLKSKCICKDCNSKLGSTIDNKFVDSFVINLKRYQECIKGRNTTENPIKEGIDKKGRKIKFNKNLKASIIPYKVINKDYVEFHSSNFDFCYKMAYENLKRKGFSDNEIKERLENAKKSLEYITKSEIDIASICLEEFEMSKLLEFIKIAYEYTYLILGEKYFNDPNAVKFRNLLNLTINKEINFDTQIKIINGLDIKDFGEESFNEIKKLLQIDSSCFILFLNRNKNDIDLLISLFGECSTTFIINVSKNGNNYVFDELPYYISVNKVID